MVNPRAIIAVVLALFFTVACEDSSMRAQQNRRAARAAKAKGDIVIGVVGTSASSNFFMNGVDLAVQEINQNGGLLGRRVRTIKYDDFGDVKRGQEIARKLSRDPDVFAVVGHLHSNVAIPVAITYAEKGILFFIPGASNPLLTQPGAQSILRNIPTARDMGRQLADFANDKGFKSVAVFYQRDAENKLLTDTFHETAVGKGIQIVATRSFFSWQTDFKSVLLDVKQNYQFDSILISGLLPSAGLLIKQVRDMGISAPIIGNDGLDSPSLLTIAGRAAEGAMISTVFNPQLPRKETQAFVKAFRGENGFSPDAWAAQGYDAISVLAYGIETAKSTVPIVLSSTLRYLVDWHGVTGSYSFTPHGDIVGKKMFFKTVQDQNFLFLDYGKDETVSLFNYAREFTIRIPLQRPVQTLDPGRTLDSTSIEVVEQLFLGLTGLDPGSYRAVPELAERWVSSKDAKAHSFYLRKDAKWTNGDPVTADDIVWAVRRNVQLAEECPGFYMLRVIKNAEAISRGELKDISRLGVNAPDKYTVVFELEHPASYFPAIAGAWVFRPLHKETILRYRDQWTDPDKIQTNGSYRLALWEKGLGLVLTKNPTYYDAGKVSIPEVRYFVIPEGSLGLEMYENNELDIIGSDFLKIPLKDLPRIRANPVLAGAYSSEPDFCTYSYVFNTGRSPVNHPLVRKAISAALHRELMIDVLSGGTEQVATTFIIPSVLGQVKSEAGGGISFDPQKARGWLSEAGYPNGKGLPPITLLYFKSEANSKFAQAVKISLLHFLNINVELLEMKWEDYLNRITQKDAPHMFLLKWCADYPDAHNFLDEVFNPAHPLVNTSWKNDAFTELMKKAEKETDPKKRNAYYKQAEQILCEQEAVTAPVFFSLAHCLVRPKIRGWYHMPFGGQHIRNWYFDKQ